MKELRFILLSTVAVILSVSELTVILTTIAPADATPEVLWLLFGCLFVGTSCALSLLVHPIKKMVYRSVPVSRISTLRQCGLTAGVLVIILFLKSLGILSPWDLVPIIASAILIEFFFEADKRPAHYEPVRPA